MSIKSQSPSSTRAPAAEVSEDGPSTSGGGGRGNAARAEALDNGGEGEPRGGSRYVIQRGDTLSDIAERVYGHARYWPEIMRANPGSVFRGGDLILVGDSLDLPVIRVPTADSATAAGDTPPTVNPASPTGDASADTTGGDTPAVVPREICTEFGDFRIYPDSYEGELPVSPDSSQNVRESEFRALEQAHEDEADARAEETVSEVDELLSYGALDWAITDGEARSALNKLAALPMRQLQNVIGRINASRLLDNLPSDAMGTAEFCKVAVALGPDRVQPYVSDLLSTGLFDWAVTDADALAVLAVMRALGADQRVTLLNNLGRPVQMTFLENLPNRGSALSAGDKAVIKSIFDNSSGDLALATLAFEIRFNLDVRGGDPGVEWDEAGLRQCWPVLEALPAAHVEGNPELLAWIRRQGSTGRISGSYGDTITADSAKLRYDPAIIGTELQESEFDADGDGTPERDPLHGVNRFNKVVRHEVGHAVDDQIGGSRRYCIGNAAGGNWTDYDSNSASCVDAMVSASNAGVSAAPEPARAAIITQIKADAAAETGASLPNVRALSEYQAMTDDEKAAVDADPVFAALSDALDSPWYEHLPNGGTPLGGRIFQKSYLSGEGNQWTSYDLAARARKVSQYQFRAPGEWFAEAYAAYYEPKADGSCDHSTLGNIDPDAKTWFDANVDNVAGTR